MPLNEDQLISQVERAVVRRAIWTLPKPVIWVLVVAIFVGTFFFGHK